MMIVLKYYVTCVFYVVVVVVVVVDIVVFLGLMVSTIIKSEIKERGQRE